MASSGRQTLLLILLTIVAVALPVHVARSMLSVSREAAVASDRPNYLAHKATPHSLDATVEALDPILDLDLGEASAVPRVFLASLPNALADMARVEERKKLFISAVLPIILRANELILADRDILKSMRQTLVRGGRLRNSEKAWLRQIERIYKLRPDLPRTPAHIDRLLKRVDVIPPSLALTQAAIESGWGTSRFAQQGNALFGEWMWGNGKGLVPSQREQGKAHKVRAFDYLLDSVLSYMRNLNRNTNYQQLRDIRAALRRDKKPVTGRSLIPALRRYSERGDAYLEDLQTVMRFNGFDHYDQVQLAQS